LTFDIQYHIFSIFCKFLLVNKIIHDACKTCRIFHLSIGIVPRIVGVDPLPRERSGESQSDVEQLFACSPVHILAPSFLVPPAILSRFVLA
jgi:hypothetical protein